ncbi:MAG: hypothetical protein ACOCS7_03195 [Halolamina sp.]
MTDHRQQEQEDRETRRRRYETLLSVIEHNTATDPEDPRRPSIAPETIKVTMVVHGGYETDGVESTIRAAIENGDVMQFRDHEGSQRLVLAREGYLKALQRREGESDTPDPELIGRCHRRLAELRGDG